MLNSKPEQFQLTEDGQILWQKQVGNPLPGEAVAMLVKGDHVLKPSLSVIGAALPEGVEEAAATECLKAWLNGHLAKVLEDLVGLENTDGMSEGAKAIALKLYDALGILPREEVQAHIPSLDEAARASLRKKKIKMGPILIFVYTLTKPAAVRLRALLWSLYHDKDLPAIVPNDGMVSLAVDPKEVDATYHRMIGYPVYASRAIRIDMVDRILNAVYDSADQGKFKATHSMAEWLGCSIPDLYSVLEAMGHKKIYDPADQKDTQAGEAQVETQAEVEQQVEAETKAAADVKNEDQPQDNKPQAVPAEKPELATFALKRGAANSKPNERKGGASFDKSSSKPKSKKPHGKKGDKKNSKKPYDKGPRVISAEADKNAADSPFAILEQLKKSS